jgi:hypothetical protein
MPPAACSPPRKNTTCRKRMLLSTFSQRASIAAVRFSRPSASRSCEMVDCVATCCALCCNVVYGVATWCTVLQHGILCCNMLNCAAQLHSRPSASRSSSACASAGRPRARARSELSASSSRRAAWCRRLEVVASHFKAVPLPLGRGRPTWATSTGPTRTVTRARFPPRAPAIAPTRPHTHTHSPARGGGAS